MSRTAHLTLIGLPGIGEDALLRMSEQLKRELVGLGVLRVHEPRTSGSTDEGAKGGDVLVSGTLAVTAAGFALRQAFLLADTWLKNRPVRGIRVELDGRSIELGHASAAERERLIDLFIAGDGAAEDAPDEPAAHAPEPPQDPAATA